MTQNALLVTLDGPGVDDTGVPVADFLRALEGVQTAVRLMVMHLGGREPGPGKPPAWVADQSRLRLGHTRPGSFTAELTQEPPVGSQMRFENRGQQALAALRDWNGVEASSLPRHVSDCLYQTADDLSTDTKLWFGSVTEQLSKAKNTSVDGIVQSWPEIARIASARRTSGEMQGAMTLDGAEA